MFNFFQAFMLATWEVINMASAWVILGFFLAGVIKVFLPTNFITRHLKTPGWISVIKASAFGVPLPLCSCSVIPVAVSLRKAGASRGAVGSFLVSTPEIGVDSFILSYGMLGPFIAGLRLIAAFISAFIVGIFIDIFVKDKEVISTENHACCKSDKANADLAPQGTKEKNFVYLLGNSFLELVDDIASPLLLGFLAAGLIAVLVPSDYSIGSNLDFFQQMFLILIISIPLYVCASSSTPIAAMLLAKGMNIGVVLIFLLVGPATNLATVLVVRKQLGDKAFLIYLAGISMIAILFAIIVNQFNFGNFNYISNYNEHHHSPELFSYILIFLLGQSLLLKIFSRRQVKRIVP